MAQQIPQPKSLTGRTIQALVIFSTLLGLLFLIQAYNVLPSEALAFVAAGWVFFAVDSVLTFMRPKTSYYLAFVLAGLALGSSLPQTAHYAFIASGLLLPSATFILGSVAQILLLILVPYHFLRARRA